MEFYTAIDFYRCGRRGILINFKRTIDQRTNKAESESVTTNIIMLTLRVIELCGVFNILPKIRPANLIL